MILNFQPPQNKKNEINRKQQQQKQTNKNIEVLTLVHFNRNSAMEKCPYIGH